MKYVAAVLLGLASVFASLADAEEKTDVTQAEQAEVLLVDINQATEKELLALPGIGKKKAAAIIQYRESKGKIASLDELQKIPGVGKKAVAKIEGRVRF